MADTLTSPQVSAALAANLAGGAAPATANSTVNHQATESPVVGASSGQVNKAFSTAFTVTNGTPYTVDLTSATDPLGNALTFSQVHSILIENLSTTAGQDFTPFGGTNGLLSTSTILVLAGTSGGAGGFLLANFGTTGVTIDGTHKIVQITVAAGTSIGGKITILGR